jgi:hypothetical protein
MKICKRCNIDKELDEFHKSSRQKDGYNYYCKPCMRSANNNAYKEHGYNRLDKIREYNRDPIKREHRNKIARIWQNNQYKNNIEYRLKDILRTRFYKAIQNNKKDSIINLIGCTINELKQHIESQFKPEMNWENQNTIWEIDHITPCDSFNLTQLEEQQKCFHYTNLQPLFKTTEIAESFGYIDQIGNRNKLNKIL